VTDRRKKSALGSPKDELKSEKQGLLYLKEGKVISWGGKRVLKTPTSSGPLAARRTGENPFNQAKGKELVGHGCSGGDLIRRGYRVEREQGLLLPPEKHWSSTLETLRTAEGYPLGGNKDLLVPWGGEGEFRRKILGGNGMGYYHTTSPSNFLGGSHSQGGKGSGNLPLAG